MTDAGQELEADRKHIRFADPFTTPIRTGAKTLTARYAFERDLDVGDVVDLIDESGDAFATAKIDLAMTMSAREFVRLDPSGHAGYDGVDAFLDRLREFYAEPPEGFSEKTPVDVFGFEVVDDA